MNSVTTKKRLTFPRIEKQQHPLATGEKVQLSIESAQTEATADDIAIAKEILNVDREFKKFFATSGEWKWIDDHKRHNYISILKEGDPESLAQCLANMFRNDASYGIIASLADARELENEILLDLDALAEFSELAIEPLSQFRECGNLTGLMTREGVIAADAPRHTYFAAKILKLLKDIQNPVVVEIGGGYGGLCREVMMRRRMRYINCDLPETLYLCYFFLRKIFPDLKIVWGIDETADICLVAAHEKDTITKADLFFNSNSFSEMTRDVVDGYMARMHHIRPRYFLHQNSNFLLFPNSERHVEVLASEFSIDTKVYTQVYAAVAPWQGAGGRYREYLYTLLS